MKDNTSRKEEFTGIIKTVFSVSVFAVCLSVWLYTKVELWHKLWAAIWEHTHTIQTECLAYITIQTLLLWKALSFLLCAGKHHWEHEQNTSKQDTNSCCCCWLHGWMPLSICLRFRGKERRQNSTNYGIHHTNHSDWSPQYQVSNMFTGLLYMTWCFFFFLDNHFCSLLHIPQLSYDFSMCVSVYRGMVAGAFMCQCGLVKPVHVSECQCWCFHTKTADIQMLFI